MGGAVPPTSPASPIVRKHEELLGGAVPPTTTATPQGQMQKKLLGRAVIQPSTATPKEVEKKMLLGGAVPPPSTATLKGRKQMKLLWGAVPPVSTATPPEDRKLKPECSTVQTSHTPIQKSEVARVEFQGKENSKEVLLQKSDILKARGEQHNIQKSTKIIPLSNKVCEMRKIWESNNISKCQDGPRISETMSICAKPMGGLDKPTVLGPANSAGKRRLETRKFN